MGKITSVEILGEKHGRRLVATLYDGTGELELVWFQGINWIEKMVHIGARFRVFGKAGFFMNSPQISHPEMELVTEEKVETKNFLEPVYASTEKLKARSLGGRQIAQLTYTLLQLLSEKDIPENIPERILKTFRLVKRFDAFKNIHFPKTPADHENAVKRLKFEELFLSQLRMGLIRLKRHTFSKGMVFEKVGDFFNDFYTNYIPFELTGAQKRVLKEIRKDVGSGKQMNRLLQGDVGSGKTMVALMAMLIAADNGFQSCFMAPTEILARQHFESLQTMLGKMNVNVGILTGSSTAKQRREVLKDCAEGKLHIITGTHALIEDTVRFKNLGLAIVDEQHRFGVAQRARLWKKNEINPHILVMTATPIPRTLALTAYGDLDYSIMDELPPGRIPVVTVHRMEYARPQVMDFIKSEIAKGRQAYIIYPLIEESAKLDFENLMKGYEEVKSYFPEPKYFISMVLLKLMFMAYMVVLPIVVQGYSAGLIIGAFLIMNAISGLVLGLVFQLAHCVEEADYPLPNENNVITNDWAMHQMNTTMNFARNNKLLSWYVGGLNFQVEHHLFPNICHVHYPEVSKILEETAREYNVPYLCSPTLSGAVRSHLQMLKKFGYRLLLKMQIWIIIYM